MASDPSLLLQKAIRDLLLADATLVAKLYNSTSVYDFVPPGSSFPYISIGEAQVKDFDAKNLNGTDNDIYIHTWTQGAGRKKAKEIMGDIYRILHRASLTVTGFTPILSRFTFAETMIDPDGQTYHGIQRFRIIITEV
jgi:hypothetical protein